MNLDELTEKTSSVVERLFEAEATGEDDQVGAMLHYVRDDGGLDLVMMAEVGNEPKERELLAAASREMSRQLSCYAVAMIGEAWARREDGEGDRDEILMVLLDARDGRRLLNWPIVREGGRRKLGPRRTYRVSEGRMARLLDPSLKEH